METKLTLVEKLIDIQSEIKVAKAQWNEFGKYGYRSNEDILQALKPLLKRHGLFVSITDELDMISDRVYIKAVVTITDGEKEIKASALAREPLAKKGMDESQITGSTSSYARKYALSGLLGLDDEEDGDDMDKQDKEFKTNSDKFTKPKANLGNFVINYGKEIKGLTFDEAGKDKVEGLLNWFIAKHEREKSAPGKDVQEFINNAREFIR